MTEPTPEPTPQAEPAQEPSASWDELFKGEDPAKVREALEQSRKWETRAKENHAKVKEYEQKQRDSMNDAERALAEAESRGAASAVEKFGTRLVKTEFDALAGRRNPDFDTASALEYVDLKKFLGEDGEPDTKAIAAAVERLVPAPTGAPPSFDGGSRTPPAAQTGMTGLIRKAAGRA